MIRTSFFLIAFISILVSNVQAQTNSYLINYKTVEIKGKTADAKAQRRTLAQTELTIANESVRTKHALSIGDLVTRSFVFDKEKNKGFLMVSGSIGNYGVKIDSAVFFSSIQNPPSEKIEIFTEDTLIVVLNPEDSLKREEFICHRAVAKNQDGFTSTFWYTPLFATPWTDNKFLQDNLPGLPLKMTIETKEMEVTMEVNELAVDIPRKEELFDVENLPLGFMEVTLSNFKKLTNEED